MSQYDTRATAAQRGYNSRWQKARASYLLKNPLCVMCMKLRRITPATVVDHIVPHNGDQKLFWEQTNWQPLCKACHDRHKQRFEKSGAVAGCDEQGIPIDASHHWNRKP